MPSDLARVAPSPGAVLRCYTTLTPECYTLLVSDAATLIATDAAGGTSACLGCIAMVVLPTL
jgi:hypothetical protein